VSPSGLPRDGNCAHQLANYLARDPPASIRRGRFTPSPPPGARWRSSSAYLRSQLQPYQATTSLRVMLQYFMTPDRAILHDPEGWWDRVSNSIGRSAPEISSRASAKANINKDTGGGFLQFTWEAISPHELESYCRVLDNTL
jgi:hypothetical protein